MQAPLKKIREITDECYGLLSIAFRRTYIEKGIFKLGADIPEVEPNDVCGKWITSPFCQIEPAMCFQMDMPILIFREKNVISEGILEEGIVGTYMPAFDLDSSIEDYFQSSEWNQLITQWKELVLEYKKHKQFKTNVLVRHIISCSICEEKEITFNDLYNTFERSINDDGVNNYENFAHMILADEEFEKRYKIYGHSLQSDYITICGEIFGD